MLIQGIPKKDTARFSPVQQAFTKTYMADQRTRYSQRTPGKEKKTLRRTSSI